MSSFDCLKRCNQRRAEHLRTAAAVCGVCAFFTTLVTLGVFGTVLALVACILVAHVTCSSSSSTSNSRRSSSSSTTTISIASVAACCLSFMTCGVAWWTVLAIFLTRQCDSNDYKDASPTNNWNATNSSSSSVWGFDTTTNETNSANEDSSGKSVDFFCKHQGWILAATIVSATLWTLTGSLVMIALLQSPPPVRRQGRADDTTVCTIEDEKDENEWSSEDGNEAQW